MWNKSILLKLPTNKNTRCIKAPKDKRGLSGAQQVDWILRCGQTAVCIRETHTAVRLSGAVQNKIWMVTLIINSATAEYIFIIFYIYTLKITDTNII